MSPWDDNKFSDDGEGFSLWFHFIKESVYRLPDGEDEVLFEFKRAELGDF